MADIRSSIVCLVLLFPQATLFGQMLRLSSTSASRGDQVVIELSLESQVGKEPVALQWETSIPATALSLLDEKLPNGSAAGEAGKSLNCAAPEKAAGTYTTRCILAGSQKSIKNGTVALLRLQVLPDAQIGTARIRVGKGLAVSGDLKSIPLEAAEAEVTIRGK